MSDLFKVEEEVINPPNRIYKLDTDLLRGFRTAVNNNQLYRAMEYMIHILDVIDTKLDVPVQEPTKAEASTAQSRKVTKQQKAAEDEEEG